MRQFKNEMLIYTGGWENHFAEAMMILPDPRRQKMLSN
jgi:hypothetical protein